MTKSEKISEKAKAKALEEEESSTDDEEEEEDEAAEGEAEDEDEEERPAVSARASSERRRARPRAASTDDHAHDHDSSSDEEDPYWWTPHAVLSTLVLVGVLGFFGMFNKVFSGIAAKPAGAEQAATAKPATTVAKPTTTASPAQKPGGDQGAKETFGAKHLLVMYKGGRRAPPTIERSKDEAKARATEAAAKAKDGKSKFEDLVKEYSDEPGAGTRGGDLGNFPKGAIVTEFQDALEKLKVGDISGIVETPFGYHVIQRTK